MRFYILFSSTTPIFLNQKIRCGKILVFTLHYNNLQVLYALRILGIWPNNYDNWFGGYCQGQQCF